jgi:hypothetical protein
MPVKELAIWYCFSDLEIGKEFFDLFGESKIKDGPLATTIKADKKATHINYPSLVKTNAASP